MRLMAVGNGAHRLSPDWQKKNGKEIFNFILFVRSYGVGNHDFREDSRQEFYSETISGECFSCMRCGRRLRP